MKYLSFKTLLVIITIFAFNFCKEDTIAPPSTESELDRILKKSNSASAISLLTSDSENSLEIDLNENLSFKEKFNIQSTLSSKSGNGLLNFTSEKENNSFFPNSISTGQKLLAIIMEERPTICRWTKNLMIS